MAGFRSQREAMLNFLFKPWPKHPIDRRYGIETSSRVLRRTMKVGDAAAEEANVGYVGSHPSVVRRGIEALPRIDEQSHFYDLGCGKGRVLVLASEYPFGSITGVELFPNVCRIARRNAARMFARHPERTRIEVIEGDATRPPLRAAGDQILFLYNPFRRPMFERLADYVEAFGAAHPRARIFILYYNPAQGEVLDSRQAWRRYFAEQVDLSDEDIRFAPFENQSESLVIWQLEGQGAAPPHPQADRPIRTVIPDIAVEVA